MSQTCRSSTRTLASLPKQLALGVPEAHSVPIQLRFQEGAAPLRGLEARLAFSSSSPSFVWVEEEGEGDAGSLVGDRAAQLHQMPVVRLVLHDVAHALVDDHLADYVGAQQPQKFVPRCPAPWIGGVAALGAGGIGVLGVSRAVGEEVAELGV